VQDFGAVKITEIFNMRILSVVIAFLSLSLGFIGYEKPDSVPFYLAPTGMVMAVITYLLAKNAFIIRSFGLAYASVFALFGVGMIAFSYNMVPVAFESLRPKPFLMIAVTVFSCLLYAAARLPLIRSIMELSEPFFASSAPDAILPYGTKRISMGEGKIGRLFMYTIIGINLVQVYILIAYNQWYGRLNNALQQKNGSSFSEEVVLFFIIAGFWIAAQVVEYVITQYLLIRWRRWMTNHFSQRWLNNSTHYQIQFYGDKADNPDQRIAEDIRIFVKETTEMTIDLFTKLLSLAAFVQVLWGLSAAFKYQFNGFSLDSVPGYLVWVALFYAVCVTFITHWIGRPLIKLNFNKEKTEAGFRFSLARIREYGEQIALLKGDKAETQNLNKKYTQVVDATWKLVERDKNLKLFTFSVDQLVSILPYILLAPAYFSGATDFGNFSSTSDAFARVQNGFSVFISLYSRFAIYKAALNRITGFDAAMLDSIHKTQNRSNQLTNTSQNAISIQKVELKVPTGTTIVRINALTLNSNQRILFTGPSGSGKSTLFRAIAGIWPYWQGYINLAQNKQIMLLPQRPYVPIGTLRSAVTYPALIDAFDDDAIIAALKQVQLPHLIGLLDTDDQWAQRLSGGEQQRLAIARALLAKPDWLFLDEATASLDEQLELKMYQAIQEHLPTTAIVSIGHRSTLIALHDRVINMRAIEGELRIFEPRDVG
jgi:vitamin B12/bleomycin/antimicrobial peptide transport system ATP-binding/permease protein